MGRVAPPFSGLPEVFAALFCVALAVMGVMLCWTLTLFIRGRRWEAAFARAPGSEHSFHWVFLVPALDEEVTIRDSVDRLLALPLASRQVVVIDDGSSDATPAVLATIEHPDLIVLRRNLSSARQGKAAALNHAYRLVSERLRGADRERVIVGIVDADGRLHPDACGYVADHFRERRVGGVQALVRIYNRSRLLTYLQDLEFGVYGFLYQLGRNASGTAGMGGNGQFNRLSALDEIAGPEGPWRDRLTEDQDLGLRLLRAGWTCRQDVRAAVNQQGVPNLRRLLRQRTRWSQGNLQAISLIPSVLRSPLSVPARAEMVSYLLMPLWQTIIGLALAAALYLVASGQAEFWAGGPWWQLAFFYVLGFGGTMIGCISARASGGPGGWLTGFALAHIYAFYSWMIWPVLIRSVARQCTAQTGWAKTAREPIQPSSSSAWRSTS